VAKVEKLISGYRKFYRDNFIHQKNDIFKHIKTSQKPKTLVISCSDSRVDPAILTNAEVGDIFVIRNVANLVPVYEPKWDSNHGTSAAIEFAVNNLRVEHIVVLGHSNCGGIKALVNNDADVNKEFSFVTGWVNIAKEVKEKVSCHTHDKYTYCEQESIKLSLNNLMTFPWLKERVDSGHLDLQGWYFSIDDASLSVLDQKTGIFKKIKV
jgi:carbonic anhydrase